MSRNMPDGTVEVVARLQPDEARAAMEAIDRVREIRAAEQAPVSEAALEAEGVSAETSQSPGAASQAVWPSRPDALVDLAGRVLAGDLGAQGTQSPRPGGERAEVTVAFARDALGTGFAAQLDDGTHVSAETFRRLACDAALIPHLEDESGRTLNVGRRTRTIPPAIRRALRQRQPTCAFPGCGHRRSSTPITSRTGSTAARPSSTTSSTSAGSTTASSMRVLRCRALLSTSAQNPCRR